MTGINRNVEGKQTRIIARYSGSAPAYRARCDAVAANGYKELDAGLALAGPRASRPAHAHRLPDCAPHERAGCARSGRT